MAAVSVSSTVSRMKGKKTNTLGWDVVVNYTETEIDALLATAHKNDTTGKKSIPCLSCQVDGTDEDTAEDYTINYDFNLAAPTITFHPTRTTPVCDLTVPIIGGTAKKSTQTNSVTIKSGIYTLQINTLELKTMKGGDDPDDSTSADKPFEFKDDTTKDGVVVIDLPTSKNLTIQIDKVSETDKVLLIDNHKDKIVDALKTKLHSSADYNSIRLELARINASKPPVGSVQLVPKCFMFAAYYPSKDDLETVLSLFIQTEDSNNGQQEDLSDYWISHWKVNLQCSPIPSGQTTSIIFNKDLIYRKMIEPSLKAQNFSSKLVDLLGNLKLSVSTGLKVHRDKYYQKNSLGDGSTEERTVTEINQTPPDLTLTLDENSNGFAECCGYWSYQYHFDWEYYYESRYSGMGGHNEKKKGGITATHTLDKPLCLCAIVDDYTLSIRCSIVKDDWKVDLASDDQSWWDKFCGGTKDIPDWIKHLSSELPNLALELGSLYFFLTTNLLMPTRKVIKIDSYYGIQVPGDFYLVGKVVGA